MGLRPNLNPKRQRAHTGKIIPTRSVSEPRLSRQETMTDPIAFFITWPTYGTWLPGDARGWIEFKHGWQIPDPSRELEAHLKMNEDACVLEVPARTVVETQVAETCRFRSWFLHAVNCRSNHMHVVVGAAETNPKKIRTDLRARCTRRLKQQVDPNRENWWAERGSIRWIFDEESLEPVILYVRDAQDRKDRET